MRPSRVPRLRRLLRVFIVIALPLVAVHFSTRWLNGHTIFLTRRRATLALEHALVGLRTLHVTAYRGLSWCRLLALDGVTYSESTNPTTCCWATACQPFDPRVRTLYAQASALLADTGVRVADFTAEEDLERKLRAADFTLAACPFCRAAYEYRAPGQPEPRGVEREVSYEFVRPGWYLRLEDWN